VKPLLNRGFTRHTTRNFGLVVSELVTNSARHAGTDIDLSIAWNLGALRLTVRDNSPSRPHQLPPDLQTHGRGLTIVTGLSRAFGALPTADGGKVVWAVLEAPATPLAQPTPSLPGHRPGAAGQNS
jgi:anti-sigma regulatory factor (Ser/Thr protein kinase)